MASKTVKLIKPVELHGKHIASVEVREPTGHADVKFGEPYLYVRNPDGAIYSIEQPDVIKGYLDSFAYACENDDVWGSVLISLLGLADTKQVKQALLGFFTDADEAVFSINATGSSSAAA